MSDAAQKYWLVMRWESRMAGHGAVLHSDRAAAEIDATAQAEKRPDTRFVVLETVGTVLIPASPSASKVVAL